MKIILNGLFFLFINFSIDINAQEIFGDWIKTSITYNDGTELSDFDERKFRYFKYSFDNLNRLFICGKYDDKEAISFFEIKFDTLKIKNSVGYITNLFLIFKITNSELILIEENKSGFTDNECIRYYFIKEKIYQNQLPLKQSDIISINKNDTVYRSSKKIHAVFLNDQSFHDYCLKNIPEWYNIMRTGKTFLATFIIRKNGNIDSVIILEKINSPFQHQFRKALAKSKGLWLAAEFGGRKVDVMIEIEISFKGYLKEKPANWQVVREYSDKGIQAIENLDYAGAIECFNLVLEKSPKYYKILYLRTICELILGNKVAACNDLDKLNLADSIEVTELIKKNCYGK